MRPKCHVFIESSCFPNCDDKRVTLSDPLSFERLPYDCGPEKRHDENEHQRSSPLNPGPLTGKWCVSPLEKFTNQTHVSPLENSGVGSYHPLPLISQNLPLALERPGHRNGVRVTEVFQPNAPQRIGCAGRGVKNQFDVAVLYGADRFLATAAVVRARRQVSP